MQIESIKHLDKEIDLLRKDDPLRNWNGFFKNLERKIVSTYQKEGKYKLMALIQYTDRTLISILSKLAEPYEFNDWDFNDITGMLYLKGNSYYIGNVSFEEVEYVCEKISRRSDERKKTEKKNKKIGRPKKKR